MPYMKNDVISKTEITDAIEITDEQYKTLLDAKLAGKKVTVRNDEPFIYSGDKRTVYQLVNNIVESQEILKEDDTPEGWQDTKPTPEPEFKTKFTSLEYLDRFTDQEQVDIVTATNSNIQIKLFYDRLLAATFIDLEDHRTEAGIDALIAAGLLDESRKEQLMTPEQV